ncbi:NlpC/P60 family protein [Chryseomicrobium sp. FSL W7-1435]|uniref:NlpC/P60 family protein n=1 Tax=Chryseomicrobium sp. FSL W7-1435 TaxID=2921704 RepID=UPI00315AEC1F
MKQMKIGIVFVLILTLLLPFSEAQAAAPTAHQKEWDYLVAQKVLLPEELSRDWKKSITRMDAVVYLARALKLEKPVIQQSETQQSTEVDLSEEDVQEDDSKVITEVESEVETDIETEVETEIKTEIETEVETETVIEIETEVETEVEITEETETSEIEVESEVDVEETQIDSAEQQVDSETTNDTDQPEKLELAAAPLFSDVPSDHKNYWMIAEFHKRGIISGYPDGTFRPNNSLNRADMARVIALTFQLTGTTSAVFTDVSTKAYFYEAVQNLVANKITVGYPDRTYRPFVATTHEHVLLFIARTMNSAFRVEVQPLPPPKPQVCEKKMSIPHRKIGVQAANFWKQPNKTRPIDAPASTNPTDLRRWSASLSENQSWWLVQQTDTQALYGDTITVSQVSGDWYKVATKDQWVPYNAAGYPGWVPASQIVKSYYDYSDCRIAIVHAKTSWLKDASTNKNSVEVSYSTILPVVGEETNSWIVAAPNDKKMKVAKADVKVHKNYASVPKPTATTVINEAKRFLGLRYIWSGTSAYGFDCSGILYAIMRTHGVLIPRDSFYQATKGTWISKSNMRAGDFVFYAGNSGKGKVYHVGLYLGDGMMLHAPNASSSVRIERYDNGAYSWNYHSARRYIQ